MTEISLCLLIGGGLSVLGLIAWLALRPVCSHKWEKSECKEYPPAVGPGDVNIRGPSEALLRLKQSHTTYIQRCSKCGIERYHTESRPEV